MEGERRVPRLHVLHLDQCDPKKCTAKKLERHGLATIHARLRTVPVRSIKLDPFANEVLSISDREAILRFGLVVVDCSWKRALSEFKDLKLRNNRRLSTTFLAGNSINYAMPGKLSTVEALAAALLITGFHSHAELLLSKFSWGHTFLELNSLAIDEISKRLQKKEI